MTNPIAKSTPYTQVFLKYHLTQKKTRGVLRNTDSRYGARRAQYEPRIAYTKELSEKASAKEEKKVTIFLVT